MPYFQFKKPLIIPSLFLFLLSFTACQKKDTINNLPIAEEDMIEIIMEALILEPAIHELPKTKQDSLGLKAYEQILARRDYTLPEFIESMEQLQANPEKLAAVYDKVMEELTKTETAISSKAAEENKEEDK